MSAYITFISTFDYKVTKLQKKKLRPQAEEGTDFLMGTRTGRLCQVVMLLNFSTHFNAMN